jgi:hypothetical protein
MTRLLITAAAVVMIGAIVVGQDTRPLSPLGTAAAQVLGKYVALPDGRGSRYQDGKWIEISYSRPLKRGRQLWGSGADYGKMLLDGAPIWRAGANVSTRLKTEAPLVFNGKSLAAGEYSLFIELKENNWTFVVSNWPAQTQSDPQNKAALWGAYGYTPDKDVVRAPMKLETLARSTEELTWEFLDMTANGGTLAIRWDKMLASVPFTVAR